MGKNYIYLFLNNSLLYSFLRSAFRCERKFSASWVVVRGEQGEHHILGAIHEGAPHGCFEWRRTLKKYSATGASCARYVTVCEVKHHFKSLERF